MYRILVVAPSWVGDTVLAQPLFMRLRQRHPQLLLDVLAPPHTMPLLRRIPQVDALIENPFRHGELKLSARRRLGASLRERRYDQAIVLPNSAKSALAPFLAGIPLRTGFRGELRRGLLNDVRRLDEKALPLMAERFASLAQPPRTELERPLPAPALEVDVRKRAELLDALGLAAPARAAVLCVGAEYGPAKRWPATHFAELARALHALGWQIWLLGSRNDGPITAEVSAASGGICVDLAGRTTLDQAVDLMSCAAVVVSNDSGLMHVAAALDRPLIALYGSSSPAFTPPMSPAAQVIKHELPCSPCFQRECPLGHFKCMLELAPEEVMARIDFAKIGANLAGTGAP